MELQDAAAVVDLARRRSAFAPTLAEAPENQRLVVIAPHPDDEIIGCGGTLLLSRQRNCSVRVVYLTSRGFEGAETRVAEARRLTAELGFDAIFLPFVPGKIPTSEDAATSLNTAIAEFGADAVFLPFLLDDHEDHRRAVELFQLLLQNNPSYGKLETWAYQVYSGAALPAVIDISAVADEKRRAISVYDSEMRKRHWAHYALGQNAAASRFLPSKPSEQYAELFLVCEASSYGELAKLYFSKSRAYYNSYVES